MDGVGVLLSLGRVPRFNYRKEFSTKLVDWLPLTSFVSFSATMYFRDPAATNSSRRFYRAAIP